MTFFSFTSVKPISQISSHITEAWVSKSIICLFGNSLPLMSDPIDWPIHTLSKYLQKATDMIQTYVLGQPKPQDQWLNLKKEALQLSVKEPHAGFITFNKSPWQIIYFKSNSCNLYWLMQWDYMSQFKVFGIGISWALQQNYTSN